MHSSNYLVSISKVVVDKSVMKTVIIMVIRIERISAGNEAWDDYRISKVESRSQI